MRKSNWVARGFLVWLFIGSGVLIQAQDQPTLTKDLPTIQFITPRTITRGDTVTITGTNLSKSGARTIVKIDGDPAEHVEVDSAEKIKVLVDTDPKPENRESAGEFKRSVVVIVGEQKSDPPYTLQQLSWEVVRKPRVWIAIALYLGIVALIVLGVRATVFKSATGKRSLSKIQMGVWTFAFGLAYVVLAAIWKEFLDVTDGMFWLMGISATTAVGAKAIVLKNEILDPQHPSRLLSDYNKKSGSYQLSLHRCQIALWTLIILVIYVIKLIGTMHLPDIPDRLLVLMGISGGTYLGFNYPKPKP